MQLSFDDFRIADGVITHISIARGEMDVFFRDWQEKDFELSFGNVIGFDGNNPVQEELSHGKILQDDEFLRRCCVMTGDDPATFHCFAFYSAWTDGPILKVVAERFSVALLGGTPMK